MKRFSPARFALAAICALGLAAAMSVRADTIGQWTFEIGNPSAVPSAWNGTVGFQGTTPGPAFPVPSDISTYGTGAGTGFHVATGTMWVGPTGNGSLRALSANQWAAGDYFQFSFTPSVSYSFSGIGLSWDQTGSSSGPRSWYLSYSTDGSTFTPAGSDYQLAFVGWNSSTVQGNNESYSLGGVLDSTLNAGGTVYFRIVEDSLVTGGAINNGNVGTGGTSRIDNFTITSTVTTVPEPTSAALLSGFAGLLVWNTIRRRR
jgi:hypothetical protein